MRSMKDKKFDDWAGVVVGILILGILSIGGCQAEQDAEIKKAVLKNKPEIIEMGVHEGCNVKYINRGVRDDSFFIAKCDNTQTLTQQYSVSSGKSSNHQTRVSITQQLDQLQTQANELRLKQEAIKKLSPEERKALGIAEEPTM